MEKPSPSHPRSHRMAWSGLFVAFVISAAVVTLSVRGVDILGLVAAATSSIVQAPATLYITSYDDLDLHVGETKKIDISVNAHTPINAIGATIKFPQDSVEVVGFSKEKSFFDLWTEETAIHEDTGEIHFSGGTTKAGGMIGTGTVLTLTVRPKKVGQFSFFFKDSQVYADDGKGTQLANETRNFSLDVREQPKPTVAAVSNGAVPVAIMQPEKPLPKSADLNGDGVVNIIDMSIMIIHMMTAPYDQRYDLNMDGNVNISDLSVLLSQVR